MGHKAVFKLFSYLAIALTLLISVFTIIANMVDFFPPDKHFFINILAFGLHILFATNVILFIYWCIFKWKIAIIPLVAILYSLPFTTRIYQFRNEEKIITSSTKVDLLTIATYNMSGNYFDEEKMTSIAENFSDLNTDIICLEEFFPPRNQKDSTSVQTIFAQWPYHLAETSSKTLPIYIFSKYPITNSHRINFLPEKNNFLYCDILLPHTSIRLFAVHLQTTNINRERARIRKTMNSSNASNKSTKEQIINNAIVHLKQNFIQRQEQVDSLRTLIDQAKAKNFPIIVCGDFNVMASQYAYKRIINAGLHDGFVDRGNHLANTYRYFHQLFRIDYILYSDFFQATAYQTFDWKMSDHKPVIMQFKQPKKNHIR